MTSGKLQAVTSQYKARLLAHETTAVQTLNSAYSTALSHIQPTLDALIKEIADAKANGETINPSWIYERDRLKKVMAVANTEMSKYGTVSQVTTLALKTEGAQLGEAVGLAQLDATKPPTVHYQFGVPSTKAINSFIGSTQDGSPLETLFSSFGTDAASSVSDALILGLTLGRNPRAIASSVQDALSISRARALTISRTEMLRSYRSANLETFQENSNVVDMWVWSAALDPRTCISCILMNGTEHELSETMASHVNCRCVQLPKTKSWSDILGSTGIDTSSMNNASAITTPAGVDWFNDQDDATQEKILGTAKYNALQNGDVSSVEDFLGVKSSSKWGDSVYVKPLSEVTS